MSEVRPEAPGFPSRRLALSTAAFSAATGLSRIDASLVDVGRVQTNIVNCVIDRHADDATEINHMLQSRGILANCKRTKIRLVTHSGVDDASVAAALDAFADVLRLQDAGARR